MIEVNLKRNKGNRSCTFGILQIPQFEFKCQTIELADGKDFYYKQNCRLDEGNYVLEKGFANMSAFFPVFKRKPKGFAGKPSFCFLDLDYMHLKTGDIGLGIRQIDNFSIQSSAELEKAFKDLFQNIFINYREILVLNIYKSKNYESTMDDYFEEQHKIESMNFLEEDDDDNDVESVEDTQDGEE